MMNKKTTISRLLLAFCLCVLLRIGLAEASEPKTGQGSEVINRARVLIREGKPGQAYALLAPLEFDLAGNVDYDYLLGISAMDSGNHLKETLAFERVLLVKPGFACARLDMARAYFALGSYSQAKIEFETALEMNPPPQAKKVVEKYLEAIERRLRVKDTTITGYVEATLGYDNNVNNSTDETRIFVPLLAVNMTLSATNVEAADKYAVLAAGALANHRIKPRLSSYLGVDTRMRKHSIEDEFDTNSFDLRGGLSFGEGADILRVGMKTGWFRLDYDTNRKTVGGDVEWRFMVNPRNQLVAFGQYNEIRYPDIKVNNFNQFIGGLSWIHALRGPRKPVFVASSYAGHEHDTEGRADGEKTFCGLRVGWQTGLIDKISIFASMGEQVGDYNQENIAFLDERKDWQFDARVGLNWVPAKNLTIRPQVSYIRNDSNIAIYEYERTDLFIALRYVFR